MLATSAIIDDLSREPPIAAKGSKWRLFTDQVMGGVSKGCQSALNRDPIFASKKDPFFRGPEWERSPRRSWPGLRSRGERGGVRRAFDGQTRCLKRQLSLPVSTMSQ
jgi:hypothetical protein